MANEEHLARLRAGVDAWNTWRTEHPDIAPDLVGADFVLVDLVGVNLRKAYLNAANLTMADLREAHLAGAYLEGTNLRGALLNKAHLRGANLAGVDLSAADLAGADLTGAKLRGANLARVRRARANLTEADLTEANLHGADLAGAELTNAHLGETIFANVDLSATKGLETCQHAGPSVLDHRTLQQSGRLPLTFLRGCGLPDRLIDYLPSLLEEAIQYYSCFISYSSKDDAFAKRLHADLQNNGVRCWFAPHDLPIGAKTWDAIEEAIRLRDKVLLILSKRALASDWVEDEVTKAFAEKRRRKQVVLFPVRIDEAILKTGEAWAVKLRDQRNIGDFRKWKEHDAYQQAFNRVLRDLKAVPG